MIDAILFAGAIGAPVFVVVAALIVLIIKGWGR